MNYQEFVVTIKEKVESILGNPTHIEIITTLKNNGYERVGLSISEPHINISPTIYLEEFYEQFQCCITLNTIANDIADLYNEVRFEQNMDTELIQNYLIAKYFIGYKVINYERNESLLKNIPHIKYLDFAVVYIFFMESANSHMGTVLITYDLLRMWNISEDELLCAAHHNTFELLPPEIKPLHEVMSEMTGEDYPNMWDSKPLYIATNIYRTFGANVMLSKSLLKEIFSHFNENYYVIPSSIHELIIVPESRSPERKDLDRMIQEINNTHVCEEEILSDKAYYYDYETSTLS